MCLLFIRTVAILLAMLGIAAHAQDFPWKPIRIIVPTSVATTSDLTARFQWHREGIDAARGLLEDRRRRA